MANSIDFNSFYGEVQICDDVPSVYKDIVTVHLENHMNGSMPLREASNLAFAVSGGSSGKACMEALCATGNHLLKNIEWLLVDERCVDKNHPDSNYKMVRSVMDGYGLNNSLLHDMNCSDPNAYETLITGKNLSLIQLGFGPDGHSASLFPNSTALSDVNEKLVVNNLDPSGANIHQRVTLTLAAIRKFDLAVICVMGEEKHDALKAISTGKPLPASMIRAKKVIWLIDTKAT